MHGWKVVLAGVIPYALLNLAMAREGQNTSGSGTAAQCQPAAYWRSVNTIVGQVQTDQLSFSAHSSVTNRRQLCSALTPRHNRRRMGRRGLTNADYLGGVEVSRAECESALATPTFYAAGDLNHWRGRHVGRWLNDNGQRFNDHATWAVEQAGSRQYGRGGPSAYREQAVGFSDGRQGYNGSSSSLNYIWGWDPKDDGSCNKGVHVGYPIQPRAGMSVVHCLLWLTPSEAFLECVFDDSAAPNGRTSTGFWGMGQWSVQTTP